MGEDHNILTTTQGEHAQNFLETVLLLNPLCWNSCLPQKPFMNQENKATFGWILQAPDVPSGHITERSPRKEEQDLAQPQVVIPGL